MEVRYMLYDYLKKQYGENEPIIISELKTEGVSNNTLRQQIKKLTDDGYLKRYDTGIYFIPKKSIFKSGSQLPIDKVINSKYLQDSDDTCGYLTGIMFANQLGITSQVSMVYEVVTNKASKDYRETTLAKTKVVLRKPRVHVTKENYRILQFLDLLREIDQIAEVSGDDLAKRLVAYLKSYALTFSDLAKYLSFYPDKIYKNMYETGLLYGISSKRNI